MKDFKELRSSGTTEIPLAQLIQEISGENVNLCFQCKKCGAGCPVAYTMDYTPIQLIHAIRLDMEDVVFKSKTIWLCASCETCTSRCPQNLDIVKIIDAVKIIVQRRNIQPAVPSIPLFYQEALNSMKFFGRLFEVGLIIGLKFRTKQFLKDAELGMKMFKKGKLKLIPDVGLSRGIATWRIFTKVQSKEKRSQS